ncbi:hypothetical protein B296_00030732 [Ensete ventricosum]|uniref:CCT-theta n=1 Tax=Ensete ventricosum TaxID=4639 RepID=A0A426ZLH8_ENSVE|nr:hypothetical protein B296_00030732 [Ensete ventricosum]
MAFGLPGYGIQAMLKEGHKHLSGLDEAVLKNIDACKQLSVITRTSLGPNGVLFSDIDLIRVLTYFPLNLLVEVMHCFEFFNQKSRLILVNLVLIISYVLGFIFTFSVVKFLLFLSGMNKMVINHLDKLFVTNDAATIVNELEVQHPAAKILVLAGKAQQEEIGDGANLTISFAGELLQNAEELIRMGLHPSEIISGYTKAINKVLSRIAVFAGGVDTSATETKGTVLIQSAEQVLYSSSSVAESGAKVTIVKNEEGGNSVSTVVLRGSTDSILDDLERAIDDGVNTYKVNFFMDYNFLLDQYAIAKFAESFEMVPKTLAENAGLNAMEIISSLYAEHAAGNVKVGIDLEEGVCKDVSTKNIWDLYLTKLDSLRTLIFIILYFVISIAD